eukprot:6204011-Pleurochrysis_carterae.AAC.2
MDSETSASVDHDGNRRGEAIEAAARVCSGARAAAGAAAVAVASAKALVPSISSCSRTRTGRAVAVDQARAAIYFSRQRTTTTRCAIRSSSNISIRVSRRARSVTNIRR